MSNIDIISLLNTDGYIMCNKKLIRLYGPTCAMIIGELCAEYKYYENRGELEDCAFFSTRENIELNTGINEYYQRQAFDILKTNGIVEVFRKGVPSKNYYKINKVKLLEIFSDDDKSCKECTSSSSPDAGLEMHQVQTNNNKLNNNINNNINNNKNNDELSKVSYSNAEKKEEFLGSIHTKQRKPKLSLYDKCAESISLFTDDAILQGALYNYLTIRLAIKSKPLYSASQWTTLLEKLSVLEGDKVAIVNQSAEKGWCSFYPLKEQQASFGGEHGQLSSNKVKTTGEEVVDETY